MRKVTLITLLALATASCESWLSPDDNWVEHPSLLGVPADEPPIDAPESAPRGTSFNVGFSTVQTSGCVDRAQNTVVVSGLDVHIHSRQRVQLNVACTQAVTIADHIVPVTVSVAGTATVHVHGRTQQGGDLVLTRAVTITP